jgi:hypothetical protein
MDELHSAILNLQGDIVYWCDRDASTSDKCYESIIYKHITKTKYENLSDSEKNKYIMNENTRVPGSSDVYTHIGGETITSTGDVIYSQRKTQTEYDLMDEDNKAVYYKIEQLYTLKPIPKETLVLMSQNHSNDSNMTILRTKRNTLLEQTDRYAITDFPYATDDDKQARLTQRQALRDLPSLVTPLEGGSMKLWVTNENGPLQAGDSLVLSNTAGYFTKGEPAVVTIKDACDFSASTTETYYSNIVSVTESNVVTTSETAQEGYTENAYWTSNTVSYYTGNVVSHYSNVVVYDGVSVYSNSDTAQEGYVAVEVSNTSPTEIEGYTPVLSYSNISSDVYDANVHTEYAKVVTHYSNVSVVETIEYSNISASAYEALDSNLVVTPGYTSFFHELSNTSIRVEAYATLTPEQRSEYTVTVVEPVTSNLQSFYTPQTKTVTHEIRDVGEFKAVEVECIFPSP